MDTVTLTAGESCLSGSANGFVNVAAPEIRDFIQGSEDPPIAPRGGGISVRAVPRVGYTATCESGSWSGSPTFEYRFLNGADNQALQSGSSSKYSLTGADVGLSIFCEVLATNAGGTGVARTNSLSPIASEAPAPGSGPVKPYEFESEKLGREGKKQEELEGIERAQRESESSGKAKAAAKHCVVPALNHYPLGKARRVLEKARCRLGVVRRPRGKPIGELVVVGQRFKPGKKLPVGTRVAVDMGSAPQHRK